MASMMSGAEMRVRLNRLGLTIDALAKLAGWDTRTLTRETTGARRVSDRTEAKIRELEVRAREDLDRFNDAAEEGTPIYLPRLNTPQEPGGLPPHWWLAIASRCEDVWGEDVQFEWGESDGPA